jgi:hypothetical protein
MRRLIFCLLLPLAGCRAGGDKDEATSGAAKAPAEFAVQRNAAGEAVVSLSPETQKRIELTVAALEPAERRPELTAYGSVLDASPLAALHGEIALDQTALEAAQKVTRRAQALFEQNENVARKTLEAAQADERADEIKLRTAERRLALEWGDAIARLSGTERRDLVDKIAAHQAALLRVELPMGEMMAGAPESIQVFVAGRAGGYRAAFISAAPQADPKTLGQGLLLRVDEADAALAPAAAVTARLRLAEPPRRGVAIPDPAIVRSAGKTWVYVAGAENKFTRREVALDGPLESGWLATNGVRAGERVVVQAAQLLLSEEEKSEIQGD